MTPPEYTFPISQDAYGFLKGCFCLCLGTFQLFTAFFFFLTSLLTPSKLQPVYPWSCLTAVSSFLWHPMSLLFFLPHLATRITDFSVLQSNYSVFQISFSIHLGVQNPQISATHRTLSHYKVFGDHLVLFQYTFLNSQYP